MRTPFRSTVLLTMLSLMLAAVSVRAADEKVAPATQPTGPLTGSYTWTIEGRDGQPRDVTLTLNQNGDKLTGTVSGWRGDNDIEDGSVAADGTVTFKVVRTWNENTSVTTYTATVSGDAIKGKSETDRNGELMTREFEGKRVKAAK